MGAAAIAFDILFSEPDRLSPRSVVRDVAGVDPALLRRLPDNDEIFARAIAGKPVVLGFALSKEGHYRRRMKAGFALTGEQPFAAPPRIRRATPLRPHLEPSAAGIGHISLDPGAASAVVRAVPLLLSDGEQFYPNLTIEALRVAQGASTYVRRRRPGRRRHADPHQGRRHRRAGHRRRRTLALCHPRRARTLCFRRRRPGAAAPRPNTEAAIAGSIVFVGTSAAGLQDIRTAALGQTVPGVSLHAQAVEQILSGRFLSRPDWADGLEILSIAAAGTLLVLAHHLRQPGHRPGLRPADHGLWPCRLLAAFFYAGLLFDPLAPIVSGLDHPFRRDRRFASWSPTASAARSAAPSANTCRRRCSTASSIPRTRSASAATTAN